MKHSKSISLLALALASAGMAHAQQVASASFGAVQTAKLATASADFAQPGVGPSHCEKTITVDCAQKPARRKAVVAKAVAVKKADPLAVHPVAAIKDTKAPEILLPGVMKVAGADAHALDFSRARIVDIANTGAQTVYVSAVDQNRIQLPFLDPKVNGTNELEVNLAPTSNNVYVQFKPGSKRPVLVYIESPDGTSVVTLQLVPKEIVGQTILVRDTSLRGRDAKPVKGGDHVVATQGLMEDVALGGAPQGYSQVDLAVGPIAMNGLVVTPEKQYSSADKDIYVYDVFNPGLDKASLQEKEFDGENVIAISIYPKPVVARNEHTKVIVLTRKVAGG
jgi:conjugal transfer pilus assembly protein TraK